MKKIVWGFLLLNIFMGSRIGWADCCSDSSPLKRASDLTYNARFAEAEALINDYIASHLNDPLGYMMRGTNKDWEQKIKNLRGKMDQAVLNDYKVANDHAFQQWNKDQDNVEKMINLGNSYLYVSKKWLDMGKKTRAGLILKKCQRHMETAIKKNPERFDAYLAVGLFNFYAANLPSGLQFFAGFLGITGNEKKGLDLMTKGASQPNLLQNDALFMLTYAYGHTKKNYPMAQNYLKQLMARYPDNPYFMMLQGEYALRAQNYDQVRSSMNTLLNFCGTHEGRCASAQLFLANYDMAASFVEQNNILAAVPYVNKAMSLNENQYPDKTAALYLYQGLAYKAEGKKEQARQAFEEVSARRDKNPAAWSRAEKELGL